MRIRRLLGTLLAATLTLALSACGTTGNQPAASTQDAQNTQSEAKLTPVSVRLDWSVNGIHAPLYAALAQGYYRAEGLDVTINPATDKDDVLKLVDSGVDTFGLYYQSSVLKSQAKGYNVAAVGAYVQHPLNVILVDQRAGVKSLKDLEGKTVGFTSDPQPKGVLSTTAASLKMMMDKAGADFSKVKLLNVGDAAVQALATQQVAALGGVYEYHEKYLLEKEGIKTDVFRLHEHGAPDFYELVVITSQQNAREQKDLIARFLKATGQGVAYTREHVDEVADLLIKAEPTLKKDLVVSSIQVILPLYQDNGQPFGAQSRERWEAAAQWLLENKLISAAPDFDRLLAK
jgi:putative hydroxymethylpyrimidine transport system substrate-binding protein